MNVKRMILGIIPIILLFTMSCEDEKATHFTDDNWDSADLGRGGQLYDKWWKVNTGTEPTTTFALYPATGAKSGSTTWRCKECHGWDYIGKDGRYSSGSHYTGIAGVWDARTDNITDIFYAIKDKGGDHDLSGVLSDNDIVDLTKFIREGLIDVSLYLGSDGIATGSATSGKTLFDKNCSSCHGADGNTLDFKSDDGVQGVGWLANDNPQETLHKIRWGHPGSTMPSMVVNGLTNTETGDILAYAQTLPQAVNYANADYERGGQLYDKWWKINGVDEPTTDFALYPATSSKSGSTTWRCKECHGWDYIGKDGRYSSGSHYTGFDGVMNAASNDVSDIFDSIKDTGGDHDLSTQLSDADIWDLTKFITEGLVDMSLYLDSNYVATGNVTNGQTLYDANCTSCHGADGNTLDFKSADGVQGVGWLSNDNPQETLHKIRWGHPGSNMPSAIADGGLTDVETGDILAYAQTLADIARGGKLYDKWWKINGVTEPTTDFDPIWSTQSTNTRSGSTTWRCKECHGWDYVGKDGRYSSGSHYTGFNGVWTAKNNSRKALSTAILNENGDHDFSGVLSEVDALDLAKFIAEGLVNMSLYITDGVATGNATNGQTLYDANCASCHGADGNTLDFKSDDGVQGVGWLADDNPQETLHKIRWGHPGSAMPSAVADGSLTDDETGDIIAYAQTL